MSCQVQLGHVESLYPHVKDDWWKGAFNELYLRTDGDVVEDPAITEAECKDMLDIQAVASLFGRTSQAAGDNCSGKNVEMSIRVLDLCCGQGRHSIYLAKKYPSIEFHGLDQSLYLINLAKERAKEDRCQNILFNVGDARHIPDEDNTFDLVILMGNSFGVYSEENDNARLLEDVARVLKPGGILLVDLVSANYTKSSFCPGGWEWINGGKISDPYTKGTMGQAEYRKLIACRERQLSSDGKWLASRELVIDLEDGIHQDLFYKLRLYELDEMKLLLEDCGLSLNTKDSRELFGPITERNDDLGMMAARHLLVAEKTKVLEDYEAMKDTGMAFYLHPNLVIDTDSIKGRMIRVTAGVKAGTLLMVDNPYALVPDITPGSGDFLPCSRLECSKRVSNPTESTSCPNSCVPEVIWCSASCRDLGKSRHDLECAWLKRYSSIIRREHGEYDFSMLWLIVRILSERYLETQKVVGSKDPHGHIENGKTETFEHNWSEICKLRANKEAISPHKLRHFETLAEDFLIANSLISNEMNTAAMVDLICKEEMNSFCLYPKATGGINRPGRPTTRGRAYGLGFYTRGTLMNHDCSPNLTHKPNRLGRMTFRASRDITAGEECTIGYFDLAEHVDVIARQKFLENWFTFVCSCKRCNEEAGAQAA